MIEVKKDTPQMKEADFGYTVQAIGPVIDVRFSEGKNRNRQRDLYGR